MRYVISPDPANGRTQVELTWETSGRETSILYINPSAGTISDVPALLKDLRFEGAGEARRDQSVWTIHHKRGGTIRCLYQVDPRRRSLEWSGTQFPITNSSFFHGLGKTFLLVPQAGGGMPAEYDVTLRWRLPDAWKAVSSWGCGPHIGARMKPDDLRDSVYLAGKLETAVVDHSGREVTVALIDRFGFTAQRLADTAAEIIRHQCEFMDEKAFPPFLVTAIPVGDPVQPGEARLVGSGLYRSFALFIAPDATLTDAVENLFAHELFHFWNGRMLRARQPDKLCYWFIEGVTDYYALRILHDSGFWNSQRYAKWVNRQIRAYYANTAIRASNEEIAEKFWSDRDTVGEIAYQRGMLLAIRWHALAKRNGVAAGIDPWFRSLVDEARHNERFEYSNETLRDRGVTVLGSWFAGEFDRGVIHAETIDLQPEALSPRLTGKRADVFEFDPGFDVARSLAERRMIGVRAVGSAARAGLREGEELLGWKVHSDPDEEFVLQVRRVGRSLKIRFFPRGERRQMIQYAP